MKVRISILFIVLGIILALVGISFGINNKSSVDFDKNYLGVVYTVNVQKLRGDGTQTIDRYSLKNVKTMLEVISEKFTMISTQYVGADPVPYIRNDTYYENYGNVYVPEAAALINKARNEKALRVYLGILQYPDHEQTQTEISLALEAAEKANAIFPGTVEAFILSSSANLEQPSGILNTIRSLKSDKDRLGVKIGIGHNICAPLGKLLPRNNATADENVAICKNILEESNFLMYHFYIAADHNFTSVADDEKMADESFPWVLDQLKTINAKIEVMGESGWPSKGSNAWENVENMKEYWQAMSRIGRKHNITIWMKEAFDIPSRRWGDREAHWGWWKLKDNSQINLKEGYQEKITE